MSSGSSPRADQRLRGIDGLRAIAARAIVVFHVWDYSGDRYGHAPIASKAATEFFGNLRVGVTLFFVLSGFLLYRPFAAAVVRHVPLPSIRRYAINRALRIMPAYWVILILTILVLDHALLHRLAQSIANLLLVQNYVPAYRQDGFHALGVASAWSLAVEVSFYVLLPFLGVAAAILVRRFASSEFAVLAPVVLMAAVGLAAHLAYRAYPQLGETWNKISLPNYADWFAAGMLLAVARVYWEERRFR